MKNLCKYSNITPEDIILKIISFKEETGKVPGKRDFESEYAYMITKIFGSFSAAIKAAGFKPKRVEGVTYEEAISSLRAYFDKYGKSPSMHTVDENLYDHSVYYRVMECKGWSEVLEKARLPIYIATRIGLPTGKNDIVMYAKSLVDKEGITNMKALLRHKKFYGIDRIISLFGSVEAFGGLIGMKINNDYLSIDAVRDVIMSAYESLGRVPSLHEVCAGGISQYYIRKKFGSYNKLLRQIGLDPSHATPTLCNLTNKELCELYISASEKNGFTNGCPGSYLKELTGYGSAVFVIRFGSMNKLRIACGYKKGSLNYSVWDRDTIYSLLYKTTKAAGRRITHDIVKSDPDLPSLSTIRRYIDNTFFEVSKEIWDNVQCGKIKIKVAE